MSWSLSRGRLRRQRRSSLAIAGGQLAGRLSQAGSSLMTEAITSDAVSPREEGPAGEHLEEDDTEGPDVGPLVDGLAARLLGGHVGGGAEDDAGQGARAGQGGGLGEVDRRPACAQVAAPGLGEAEVEHLDLPVGRELHVRGLQVAVDDALGVGLLERLGDLLRDLERLLDGDGAARETLLEVLALHELERQEGLAVRVLESVDRGDVRVVERGEQLRLALEAGEALGVLRHLERQHLDRDVATEGRVGGAVDLAHPAGPEGRGDPVVRQRLADQGASRRGTNAFSCSGNVGVQSAPAECGGLYAAGRRPGPTGQREPLRHGTRRRSQPDWRVRRVTERHLRSMLKASHSRVDFFQCRQEPQE